METRLTDLRGKEVTSLNGERLGRIANLVIDSETGRIATMLVTPTGLAPEGYSLDDHGRLELPFDCVRSVKDMVMVKL